MKSTLKFTLLVSILFLTFSCTQEVTTKKFRTNDSNLTYKGRVDKLDNEVIFISSASSVTTKIIGSSCLVHLKNNSYGPNYVSIEVDGKIVERISVSRDSAIAYPVKLSTDKNEHIVTVYKATEANSGDLTFHGITAEGIEGIENTNTLKIEFIGDSITCAAGAEIVEKPCDEGEYYDHSDGYNSYASIAGRKLNADVVLSSVSGIGIYRNWNSVKGEGPIMPEVYENLYLSYKDKSYDFSGFTPDIISICLGTNDFSDGDGVKERLPFDAEKYTNEYIKFLKTVIKNNPTSKIILLDSPMVKGEKSIVFNNSLANVKAYFTEEMPETSITLFQFGEIHPTGCGYHPAVVEHQEMAKQLVPILKELI